MSYQSRSLALATVICASACFTFTSCRVIDAPIEVSPSNPQEKVVSVVRDGIEPALKTMTGALGTVGVVYKTSVSLAGNRAARNSDGRLLDGSGFFMPSSEDELKVTPADGDRNLREEAADTGISPDNQEERKVYDFKYTLNGSQTITFPDPDLKLKIDVSGSVQVDEGNPSFLSVDVVAEVFSKSAPAPNSSIAKFKIASLYGNKEQDGQLFQVSFTEYRRLIHFVNSTSSTSRDFDSGSLEILITKDEASLKVTGLLLDPVSNLRFDAMNAKWNFTGGYFFGEANLSFTDSGQNKFGLDIAISPNNDVSTKIWKLEPQTSPANPPSNTSGITSLTAYEL